jgi:hypothetical protein
MSTLKKTSTLLAAALLLAGTLARPAEAQQGPKDGSGTKAGASRQLGPADGSGLQPAPKDGTGYGSPYRSKSALGWLGFGGSANGSGTGTCDGTGPRGNGSGGGSGSCDGSGPKSGGGGRRGGRR